MLNLRCQQSTIKHSSAKPVKGGVWGSVDLESDEEQPDNIEFEDFGSNDLSVSLSYTSLRSHSSNSKRKYSQDDFYLSRSDQDGSIILMDVITRSSPRPMSGDGRRRSKNNSIDRPRSNSDNHGLGTRLNQLLGRSPSHDSDAADNNATSPSMMMMNPRAIDNKLRSIKEKGKAFQIQSQHQVTSIIEESSVRELSSGGSNTSKNPFRIIKGRQVSPMPIRPDQPSSSASNTRDSTPLRKVHPEPPVTVDHQGDDEGGGELTSEALMMRERVDMIRPAAAIAVISSDHDPTSTTHKQSKKQNKQSSKSNNESDSNSNSNSPNGYAIDNTPPSATTISIKTMFKSISTTPFQPHCVRIARYTTIGPVILCLGSDSNDIKCYSLEDGSPRLPALTGHTDHIAALAISNPFYSQHSADNKMTSLAVSGSHDQHLRIWNLDTGTCMHAISNAHKCSVTAVAICVRERGSVVAVSAGEDGSMKAWDGSTDKKLITYRSGHTDKVLSIIIFNPKGTVPVVFSAGVDKIIHAWDMINGTLLRSFEGHHDEIQSLAVQSFVNIASLVPFITPEERRQIDANIAITTAVDDDNKSIILVSAGRNGSIHVWDFRTGYLLLELLGHHKCVTAVDIILAPSAASASSSSNKKKKSSEPIVEANTPLIIAAGEDGTIKLWNMTNGKFLKSCRWHGKASVSSLDTALMTVEGQGNEEVQMVVTCGMDKTIQVHDVQRDMLTAESYCTIC